MLLGAVASWIPGFVRTSLGMETTDAAADGEKAGTHRLGRYHALPDDQCAICADNASYDVTHLSVAADSYAAAAALSATEPGPSTSTNAPDATAEEGGAFPLNTPYAASCGHKYCYVCLADAMLRARDDGGPVWACLRCASPVVWSERACADGTDVEDRSASESGSEYEFTDTDLDTDALGESTESIGSLEYPSNDSTSA
jgi:peroxin-2